MHGQVSRLMHCIATVSRSAKSRVYQLTGRTSKRTWTCEVERASMQVWRKNNWLRTTYPRHIIEAFYVRMPQKLAGLSTEERTTLNTAKEPIMSKGIGNLRSLQRILIYSEYLFQEFLDLTGVHLVGEPIVLVGYELMLSICKR